MEKYTKIPATTFQQLAVNAGVLLSDFDPTDGTFDEADMLGPTSGGVNFTATPSYKDWGEDIDNCPKNTKELKRLENWDVKMSGSFVACSAALARVLTALADVTGGKITPRDTVDIENDFQDVWLVGDYGDVNTGEDAGFIAIHLMDALSTGGFQLQTADKEKGKFAFEFTGHYSLDAQDTVPFEIYIKGRTPSVSLNKHDLNLTTSGATSHKTLIATTVPSDETVTWTSSNTSAATVSNGTVTGVANGLAKITASITVDGVTYSDSCYVEVT